MQADQAIAEERLIAAHNKAELHFKADQDIQK